MHDYIQELGVNEHLLGEAGRHAIYSLTLCHHFQEDRTMTMPEHWQGAKSTKTTVEYSLSFAGGL